MMDGMAVIARAESVWPMHSIPYSQQDKFAGYRQDCSGYVSAVYGVKPGPMGGLTTVTLVTSGAMGEIPVMSLRAGDLVGRCGVGTAGDAGHITIFRQWYNRDPGDSRYWGYEQAGDSPGPNYRVIEWADGYRAYRWREDGFPMSGDTADFAAGNVPVPGQPGKVCGAHVAIGSIWAEVLAIKASLSAGAAAGVKAEDIAAAIIRQLGGRP
jgi:hypothetical protein